MLLILYLNKEKAKSNYHSRSPILNVEACFDTLDEKCSAEKNWMFSCRQGPRNVFACVFRHCDRSLIYLVLVKSGKASYQSTSFLRECLNAPAILTGSARLPQNQAVSQIYIQFVQGSGLKKQTLSFKNANCSGNAIKRFCQIQLYFTKNCQNSFQSTARNSRIRADAKSIHFVCSFHQIKVKPIDTEDQYFSLFSHQKKIAQPLIITPCSKSG